ncbi:MAG TPA: hypothetical protein VNN55_00475 [bacterium]|nr:hypothetical protein [bacterium]
MRARRIIFALLAVAMIAVMIWRPRLPITVTDSTRAVFAMIDALDSNAVVMISFDHEASSLPEIGPIGAAIADHCFRRGIKVVGLALFSEGNAIGYDLLSRRAIRQGREYGDDWIYLGFRPQYTAAILGMGEDIGEVFATDYLGAPLSRLPLGARVRNYEDIDLVVSVADGSMPTYWIEYAANRYGEKVVAALSAVMVTSFTPYQESGQLAGILTGLKGAAEYEQLLQSPAAGVRGMAAQSAAHVLIALLVLWGNIEAWRSRKRRAA